MDTMIAMRRVILSSSVLLACTLGVCAQDNAVELVKPMAKDADPVFEVAAIKPSDPNDDNDGFHLNGRHISIKDQTVMSLICFAYAVNETQIIDAPKWFDEQHWDIDGVSDVEGEPSLHQYQRMVEKVLAARFGLQMHHDKRELSGYTLTVAKGGPKLEKSKSDPDAGVDQTGSGSGSQRSMKFTNSSMSDFTLSLQVIAGRPVRNQTNLLGRYDFILLWTPNELRATDASAPPGLFTAIQEELGLKLDASREPTDVLVIDRAERPAAN